MVFGTAGCRRLKGHCRGTRVFPAERDGVVTVRCLWPAAAEQAIGRTCWGELSVRTGGIWSKCDGSQRDGELHVIWVAAVRKGFDKPACAPGHFASSEVLETRKDCFHFGCTIGAGLQRIASIERWEAGSCLGFCYADCAFDGA